MTKTSPTAPTAYDDGWSANGTAPEPAAPESPPRAPVPYRRFAVLAAGIVAAGTLAGLAGGIVLPDTHAARAEIRYPITEELPTGFLREDRNLTTQLVFMRTRAVLGPAAAAEEIPLAQLEDQVTISLLDSSEIIQVEVTDSSPALAKRLVGDVVETYLQLAQEHPESAARGYVESELADVEAELDESQQQLGELLELAADGSDMSEQVDAATTEVDSLLTRAGTLRQELDDISIIERAAPTAELITQPYALDSPVSPGPTILGAAGAMTGVVVAACVLAFLARRHIRG